MERELHILIKFFLIPPLSLRYSVSKIWACKMAQWVRVLATKPGYMSSIPQNPHIGRREPSL